MANNKTGFDYYNVDTDRYQDIKIKRLKKDFGTSGIAVYDYILCEIYRVRGCFLVWDESTAFDVAEYFGLKETLVNEIVNYCCVVGLFDKALLACGSIITSRSIQLRFIEMSTRAKRKDFKIPEEINIITEKRKIIPEQPPIIPEFSDKGKESKGNNPIYPTRDYLNFPPAESFDLALDECFAKLMLEEGWLRDAWERAYRTGFKSLTFEECRDKYVDLYFWKLKGEGVSHKSISDAKHHFSNWLITELKKQKDGEERAKCYKGRTVQVKAQIGKSECNKGAEGSIQPFDVIEL